MELLLYILVFQSLPFAGGRGGSVVTVSRKVFKYRTSSNHQTRSPYVLSEIYTNTYGGGTVERGCLGSELMPVWAAAGLAAGGLARALRQKKLWAGIQRDYGDTPA